MRRNRVLAIVGPLLLSALPSVAAPASAAPVPGTITTIAGGPGWGPAGGVRISPYAIAVRGANVYFTDYGSEVVRVLDPRTGDLRVVAGNGDTNPWALSSPSGDGGPATATRVIDPAGLALDSAGNVFIGERTGGGIRKVDAAGTITRWFATAYAPLGLAVDGGGNLYVAEGGVNVFRVSPSGARTEVTRIGSPCCPEEIGDGAPAEEAQLSPSAVAVDGSGNLFVSDLHSRRVRKIDPGGTISTVAGGGSGGLGDGGPATQAILMEPRGIALDGRGNLYIADTGQDRIRKVDASGTITTVAGGGDGGLGDGGPATAATLAKPHSVAVADDGSLFVADTFHQLVRRVDRAGVITSVAGLGAGRAAGDGGPAVQAQLNRPRGISLDRSGNIFVADAGDHRVRRIDSAGTIATVAGTGELGFAGDGGPATAAKLREPEGAAPDSLGNLYIADHQNFRVRKVDSSGVIMTVAGGGSKAATHGLAAVEAAVVPRAVTVDSGGLLVFADEGTDKIWRVDRNGRLVFVAAAGMRLNYGAQILFDALGNLYVSAGYGPVVRRIDPTGTATTVAGGGPNRDARYATGVSMDAFGIAVDANGNLFVGDTYDDRVFRVDQDGFLTKVAGNENIYTNLGDGGPAVEARLDVGSLATDESGGLLIVDVGTSRIRRVAGIAAPNRVVAAGWNVLGQLGIGSTSDAHEPVTLPTLAAVRAIAAGYYHSLAVKSDGTVRAWGWNVVGELGDGSTTDRSAPVPVLGLSGVTEVAAGVFHSLALRVDGSVWAWGWNAAGMLGDGTTTDRQVPVRVTGLPKITAISAGAYHSIALAADGSVWAWGWNGFGQLGDSTTTDRWSPVRIPALSRINSISAGAFHSLAAGQDAFLWSWGWNGVGQLGDGTTTDRWAPVQLRGTFETEVTAGAFHSVAWSPSGPVYAWGWNRYGQLGTGSSSDVSTTPAEVAGLGGARSVRAGGLHTVAILADGTAWTWGANGVGELATGTTADRRTAARTPALDGSTRLSAGAFHTMAVR